MTTAVSESCGINVWSALGGCLAERRDGRVHSVFRSSLNLGFGDRLVHIGSQDDDKPPFGIQVDRMTIERMIRSLDPGLPVCWQGKDRILSFPSSDLTLKLSDNGYHSHMTRTDPQEDGLTDRLETITYHKPIRSALNGFDTGTDVLLDQIAGIAAPGAGQLFTMLDRLKDQAMSGKLERRDLDFWIGRGQGLTPGGDDLITGLTAFLCATGQAGSFLQDLEDYLRQEGYRRTTQIGYEYLWYAARREFSENIRRVCVALLTADDFAVLSTVRQLIRHGHTSGVDALLGILTAAHATIIRTSMR